LWQRLNSFEANMSRGFWFMIWHPIKQKDNQTNRDYYFIYILKILRALLSRLLGRFAPIFYLNREHVLFVYILKQRRTNFLSYISHVQSLAYIIKEFSIFYFLYSIDIFATRWCKPLIFPTYTIWSKRILFLVRNF